MTANEKLIRLAEIAVKVDVKVDRLATLLDLSKKIDATDVATIICKALCDKKLRENVSSGG